MPRTFVLISLMTMILSGWPGRVCSDEPIGKLSPILHGEGDLELAPHGQGNVYAPQVLWDGKMFRMWYGCQGKDGHDRIACAESADGKRWFRKGIVLNNDTANHVNDPSVVIVNGKYFMYCTRTEKDVVDRIDVAVSDDGQKWLPQGVALAPGPNGSWDALSVGRPAVVFAEGQFKMWYDGRKDFPLDAPVKDVPKSSSSYRSVGYATSKDGINWTRYTSDPVFLYDAGAVHVTVVDGTFVMLYESRDGTSFARSSDGKDWTNGGIFMKKSGSPADAFGHVTPFLYLDPDQKIDRLFVGAASATTWDHNHIAAMDINHDLLHKIVFGQSDFELLTRQEQQALNDFHKLYQLDEEQLVKYIKPPFVPGRLIDRKLRWKDRWGNADHGKNGMYVYRYLFYERDGKLQAPHHFAAGSHHPEPKDEGSSLAELINMLMSQTRPEIDDPDKLLEQLNVGDYVIRENAPQDQVVAALGEILKRECGVPIKLELRAVEHAAVVVRGKLKPTFVSKLSPIQLYAETLLPLKGEVDSGNFQEFLNDVGRFISPNRRIIHEIENPLPWETRVFWHRNIRARFDDKTLRKDRAVRPVLDHLQEQTGLTFSMESRKIPTIIVERSE
ncbi:MAG: putative lipoprotein [Planctomycetaceae bacterium]|nr:putative lipoprotein [Planctomycetaceae bacterium]